ncbi:hypothetical protein GCM10010236_18730 [Streptomyces eurythermus]|nr:hypothetical protein GCM10010236_18730 [Streptomyces eurythermus]
MRKPHGEFLGKEPIAVGLGSSVGCGPDVACRARAAVAAYQMESRAPRGRAAIDAR